MSPSDSDSDDESAGEPGGRRTESRAELAKIRITRLLQRSVIATMRTIEQKIADAGPYNQRIDPHILTRVRSSLLREGQLGSFKRESGEHWTHLANTPHSDINARLAVLEPIIIELNANRLKTPIGQALEIAIYRALIAQDQLAFYGGFRNLELHDDSKPYSKEEPPTIINGKQMRAPVDFIVVHREAGHALIEAKNIRPWVYPHQPEVKELLSRALAVDAVPVLIARRYHISTLFALRRCGLVLHETYNQRFPVAAAAIVAKAKDKTLLGYHDIRLGNEPDARLLKFVHVNLPSVLVGARTLFDTAKDLIERYVTNDISYPEFAARLRRRATGGNEDNDWSTPR